MREFRVSHSSGSYLCSYQGCPRASQGFSSLELRQQHEESHAPRFQCSNPACGFWKCSSEAALRKHTTKYHDGQDVSSVPNSLNSSVRGVPQERSLFRLATPRRRSLLQEYDFLASTRSSMGTSTRSSMGTTPGEHRPALFPPPEPPELGVGSPPEYITQLFLLRGQHRDLTGWQATTDKQERLANVQQMYVSPFTR